jgi:hypothetical protein
MDLLPSNGEPIQIEKKKSQTQKAQQADDAHGRGINRGARGYVGEAGDSRCAASWRSKADAPWTERAQGSGSLAVGIAVFGEVGGGRSGGLAVQNGDRVGWEEAFDLIF